MTTNPSFRLIAAATLTAIVSLCACADVSATDVESLRRTALANQGSPERALPQLDQLAQIAPDDAGLALLHGKGLMAAGRYEEAVFALRAAVKMNGNLKDAKRLLADAIRQRALADPLVRRAGHVERGERLLLLEAEDLALAAAQDLLAASPGDPRGLGLRGRALAAHGRFQEAARDLEAAIRARPRDFALALVLFRVYGKLGQREGIARLSKQFGPPLEPADAPGMMAMALKFHRDGIENEAFYWARRATQADPASFEAHYYAADYLLKTLDTPKARLKPGEVYQAAPFAARAESLARDREDRAQAAWLRGRVEITSARALWVEAAVQRQGCFPKAVAHFDRALSLNPYLHMARLDRGLAHVGSGNRRLAANDVHVYLAANPGDEAYVDGRMRFWGAFNANWQEVRASLAQHIITRIGGSSDSRYTWSYGCGGLVTNLNDCSTLQR